MLFGAMEGYGPMRDYLAYRMEVPYAATTKHGTSYRKVNHWNTTKEFKPPWT
jgi:hypothetical protein